MTSSPTSSTTSSIEPEGPEPLLVKCEICGRFKMVDGSWLPGPKPNGTRLRISMTVCPQCRWKSWPRPSPEDQTYHPEAPS